MPADPAKARAVQQRNAAYRATDDPVRLARAARIVRAAIERGKLTPADLAAERDRYHADRRANDGAHGNEHSRDGGSDAA